MLIRRLQLLTNTGWLLLVAILLAVTSAVAQFPDKFTNLQVLPKNISQSDLQTTMRGFAFALNVRCPYCHVQKADMKMDSSRPTTKIRRKLPAGSCCKWLRSSTAIT